MSLRTLQTRIVTQMPDVLTGTITGFVVASFRVWEWSGGPGTPMQVAATTLDCARRNAIVLKDAGLCFVCDGGAANFLYAVDTSNPTAPVVLDSVDLSG